MSAYREDRVVAEARKNLNNAWFICDTESTIGSAVVKWVTRGKMGNWPFRKLITCCLSFIPNLCDFL